MKPSYILLNVVLVAGGIFIYDALKAPPQAATPGGHYEDPLRADDLGQEPEERATMVTLDGGGKEILARRNANRLDDLERELAVLRRGGAPLSGSEEGTAPAAPPLALEEPELDSEGKPSGFDEPTLRKFEQYMDEVNRRKMEERQRGRVAGELARLGVELSDEQQKSVIDTTLAFQAKARDLLRHTFTRDEKGREDRKKAYQDLREEYKVTINRLVPTAEAEKIFTSRIARGLGFSSGAFGDVRQRGGRAGGRGGNRTTRKGRGGG